MFWYFAATFLAGFAAGWAFFKHRSLIKQVSEYEANQLRKSAANEIQPK